MYIKKGDNVIVLTGKDRGKKGSVVRALPAENKVVVEGVNMAKRHKRARRAGQKGEIITVTLPVSVSNVALLDPKSGKPTRIGMKEDGGKRVRVAKKSGGTV